MKKITLYLILLFFFFSILSIVILSTFGIETNKFNNLISQKINQTNNNINLKLNTIKFKLDIKAISLFLETIDPQIDYRGVTVPAKNIKVYINFASFIKTNPQIERINLILNQLDIEMLKKLVVILKPSNFTSFIGNKIQQGKINTELDIYLDNNNLFENFIAKGSVSNLRTKKINNIDFNKINFSFFADKEDILINNFSGESSHIKIQEGDLKLKLSPTILIESNFKANIKYNNKFKDYKNLIGNFKYVKDINNLTVNLKNNILVELDKTYKVKNYNYNGSGEIVKANIEFKKTFESNFLKDKISQISFKNSKIKTIFNSKKKNIIIDGKYSLNGDNFLLFNLDNVINKELLKLKLDAEYDKPINLEIINFKKKRDSIANFSINLEKQKNKVKIKKISIKEKDNIIYAEDIELNKDKFVSFKKISVTTSQEGKKNNDFTVSYGKKINIKGTVFDANSLPKILNQKNINNQFTNINKNIEIDFKNILAPLSENLKNFKLIGQIEKGKFIKISSKGDYGENNYLDISMKKDKKSNRKYLEIYSDLTRPLLTEYDFFKGLTGGKLFYSSIIDEDKSISKLKIENFKLINAPGMIKLLSLADLGGLEDLAAGEGLSFDILEINMEANKNILKLNEILALGPSVSVLMEGYYDNSGLTSMKGTLIPAKTLNKMISKIPVLGKIIIPKEVGEGLFGISFKIKGSKDKIKTTINPIRTLTPRFIQKIIEKKNKLK